MSTSTGFENPSASQKVLSLPELVLETIKDLTPRDLHSAALVCHIWSGIALDYLWRRAGSLAPLFNTLAPMRYSEAESNWTFVAGLGQADWPRFHAYARRIRVVEIRRPWKRWSKPVSVDSMEIVRLSMPSGYHFPRPIRLSYNGISHQRSIAPLLRNFLHVVSTSTTQLEVFDLVFAKPDVDNTPMQDLFRRFGALEVPSLESVTVENSFYRSNSPSFPGLIKAHASTIHELNLRVPHNEELWIATRSLQHLKRLSLDFKVACDSRLLGSPKDSIVALDDVTSGIFPKLEAFSAVLPSSDFGVEHRRLEIFKCISRPTQLVSLTLASSAPLMLYASEMWHVGQSLHQLETLRIDIRPLTEQAEAATGSSLVSILQVFPQIKYLDTGIICDSIPDTAQTKPHTSLEVLDLSWSPAPKAHQEEIARFLSSILPRGARVIHMGERRPFGLSTGKAAWGEVARLVDEAA